MTAIDPYSVAAIPIELLFDATVLGAGTAFVWATSGAHFLITNWHNVSGRNPFDGKHVLKNAGEPNSLRVWFNKKNSLGEKVPIDIPLHEPSGKARWFIHPVLAKIDVVALPFPIPPGVDAYPINLMASEPLLTKVGMDAYVLGYPFGFGVAGLPVWKRGSIASEPDVLSPEQHYFLLDTASRPGMSGSPVIMRSWGAHLLEDGNYNLGGPLTATRFIGIYSGRLHTTDPLDAQLGIIWPEALVQDICAAQKADV